MLFSLVSFLGFPLLLLVVLAGVGGEEGVEGANQNQASRLNLCQPLPSSKGDETEEQALSWHVPSPLMFPPGEHPFGLEYKKPLECQNFREYRIPLEPLPSTSEIQLEVVDESVNVNVTYLIREEQQVEEEDEEEVLELRFSPHGYLSLNNEYFNPDQFCVQSLSHSALSIKICEVGCSEGPCIPICCGLHRVIMHNGTAEKCVSIGGAMYKPSLYRDVYHQLTPAEDEATIPHFIRNYPQCLEHQRLMSYPFKRIHNVLQLHVRILSSGRAKYFQVRDRTWRNIDNFCLSGLIVPETNKDVNNNGAAFQAQEFYNYSGKEEDQIIYFCTDFTTNEVTAPLFYLPFYLINTIFLSLTALVYILLWEKQNVHGWTILCFVLSMLFMFIFLGSSHLLGFAYRAEDNHAIRTILCPLVGIFAHFFFLSTFTWLSVVNFDLYITLKSMAPVSGRSRGVKRFLCYMIFAWGLPGLIITTGLVLTQTTADDVLSEVRVPGYGKLTCFLEPSVKGIYLYYDIGVLVGLNMIFMLLTLYTIYQFKRGTRAIDSARSNSSQTLSAKLFFKLFTVVGVTWSFEVISWWQIAEETTLHFLILDMFNFLQSVGVFFIFVCKRKILNQLEQKYPSLKVLTGPLKRVAASSRRAANRAGTATVSGREKTQSTAAFSMRRLQSTSQKIHDSSAVNNKPMGT